MQAILNALKIGMNVRKGAAPRIRLKLDTPKGEVGF
jgi:hypothetical protein